MPNKFTPSPRELMSRSWLVDISGGSKLVDGKISDYQDDTLATWTYSRWTASNTMKIEIRMRNIPFAKPDNVSILPNLRTK